jgi:hypothetical protein
MQTVCEEVKSTAVYEGPNSCDEWEIACAFSAMLCQLVQFFLKYIIHHIFILPDNVTKYEK